MSVEGKPEKVSLETTELKVGGVNIKGAWIVWGLAIAGSIAGSIVLVGSEWERYQRVQAFVKEFKAPDLEPLVTLGEKVRQLEDNIVNLSQSLASVEGTGNKLVTDVQSINKLMEANDVSKLQGAISQLKTTVEGVQVFTRDVQSLREQMVAVQKDMTSLKKDVDAQWGAIDNIGAGALKGR